MTAPLPPLYTHVMGSHGFPGWFWTALDKIKAGEYGQTDVKESFDDATLRRLPQHIAVWVQTSRSNFMGEAII